MKNSGPQGPWSGHAKQPSFVERERERKKSYLLFIHRPTMCGKEGIPQKAFSQKAPTHFKAVVQNSTFIFQKLGRNIDPQGLQSL